MTDIDDLIERIKLSREYKSNTTICFDESHIVLNALLDKKNAVMQDNDYCKPIKIYREKHSYNLPIAVFEGSVSAIRDKENQRGLWEYYYNNEYLEYDFRYHYKTGQRLPTLEELEELWQKQEKNEHDDCKANS